VVDAEHITNGRLDKIPQRRFRRQQIASSTDSFDHERLARSLKTVILSEANELAKSKDPSELDRCKKATKDSLPGSTQPENSPQCHLNSRLHRGPSTAHALRFATCTLRSG